MKIVFIAKDIAGNAAVLEVVSSSSRIDILIDNDLVYQIPKLDWPKFTDEMLRGNPPPPELPASRWIIPGITRNSFDLHRGERFQLLPSSINLACNISDESLFDGALLTDKDIVKVFFGRKFSDMNGNFLYVPGYSTQNEIAGDAEIAETMFNVGYVFQCIVNDGAVMAGSFYYRPYNTGFSNSSRWPIKLQEIWHKIEDERHK